MLQKMLFFICLFSCLNCEKDKLLLNDLMPYDTELEVEWVTVDSGLLFTRGDNLYWEFKDSRNLPAHKVTLHPYQIC